VGGVKRNLMGCGNQCQSWFTFKSFS